MALIADSLALRIVLDLLKDRDVTNVAPYQGVNVDKLDPVFTTRVATSFIKQDPMPQLFDNQNPPQPRAATAEEVCAYILRRLREYLRGNVEAADVNAAVITTQTNTKTSLRTELDAGLGNGP